MSLHEEQPHDSDSDSAWGSDDDSELGYDEQQMQRMRDFIEKYSDFATVPPKESLPNVSDKHCVVMTGTTGGLGAHMLAQILQNPSVEKVYCLVRAMSDERALERVNDTLRRQQLPTVDDSSSRVVGLNSIPEEDYLGLEKDVYEEVRKQATVVAHVAWNVNFNLSIESFEPQLKGLKNLIDLAITARNGNPASFFFASTVAAVGSTPGPVTHEEVSEDPSDAQSTGYGRSKWVAEQLCHLANKTRGVRSEFFRIGQLTGDTENGVWTESEAIPLLIRSAQVVGALPEMSETLYWLPVNISAKTCLDLVFGTHRRTAWHSVNPGDEPTTWADVLTYLKDAGLEFKIVPNEEWLDMMRASTDVTKNPAIKLLEYYEHRMDEDNHDTKQLYETIKTKEASPTLKAAGGIKQELVSKFVKNWKSTGFLQ